MIDHSDLPKGLEQLGFGSTFRDEICTMLESIQMFSELGHREIEILAGYVQAYRAPPKTVLLREGKRDSYMCLIVEGKLEVFKERNEGEQRRLATIRGGKSIGEMALIDAQPHSATVITREETTLLLLTRMGFDRLREEHPRLAFDVLWKIAQLLSFRLRQTSGMLVDYLN